MERFFWDLRKSYGYLKGTYARDKDAVVASMLICEMAAFYKAQGMTLIDALDELFENYGYYGERVKNIQITGFDANGQMAEIMKKSPQIRSRMNSAETRLRKSGTIFREKSLLPTEQKAKPVFPRQICFIM